MLEAALKLIKQFEGCRLTAYTDMGGRVTIGWGSTGPDITLPLTWNQAQCDERLAQDAQKALERVNSLIKVPINDNQKAALIDFVYNLGGANLARSGLLRMLNSYRYEEAAEQFLLWNRVGSYVSAGLTRRRQAEKDLFLS